MYFTSGSDRAFEQLMQTRPGADHFDSGEAGAPEDCGTCRFYRPHWKYQFCVYEECPYQPGKRTALDGAVKFQVKGVDDEMAVFRVEKNRGYTVMSNHHLRNKDLSLKAKGLLSQMLSLPEDWDFTLKGLSLINREQIDAIRAAIRELEQAGYIVRSRERDSQGRLRGADYVIYEQPQPVLDSPTLENPMLDNPTQEKPTLGKPSSPPKCCKRPSENIWPPGRKGRARPITASRAYGSSKRTVPPCPTLRSPTPTLAYLSPAPRNTTLILPCGKTALPIRPGIS